MSTVYEVTFASGLDLNTAPCGPNNHFSQRMTKSAIRPVQPAKTQITMRVRGVWSDSSLIACAIYSIRAILREMNKNPCHTVWLYRLIWIFAGPTHLIVGFIVRLLSAYRLILYFYNS